ncbi:transposase [Paenalcaligenes hominis]|uniref:Transposase n=1 Tax=Paenalcaligenes hominis TaxID=643674 RepID=A0ABX0WR65_9BURK|nr:transposase [Paenalcaligenes hominis]GGE72160.1 hypothetical protein GCM10007278_20510 [Paenalcaligenes hominis]
MRRFAGACRFVFNRALAWQKDRYAADSTTKFSYTVLANFLPVWKKDKETEWLKHSPSQCLQQTLKDLERAYKNFFEKHAAFPRFKKKGQSDRFRYPQGCKLDQENSRIFLPKPRDGVYRGFKGKPHEPVGSRHHRATGAKRSGQVRSE